MDKSLILHLGQEEHKISPEQLVLSERKKQKQNKAKQTKNTKRRTGAHPKETEVKVKVNPMAKMEQVDKYNK